MLIFSHCFARQHGCDLNLIGVHAFFHRAHVANDKIERVEQYWFSRIVPRASMVTIWIWLVSMRFFIARMLLTIPRGGAGGIPVPIRTGSKWFASNRVEITFERVQCWHEVDEFQNWKNLIQNIFWKLKFLDWKVKVKFWTSGSKFTKSKRNREPGNGPWIRSR